MDMECSIDDNYVQHCGAMLTSFFINNLEEKHTIHLLIEKLEPQNITLIRTLVESFGGCFSYYIVDRQLLENCPIKSTDHLTITTYYRLFIADILPNYINKVLYLDCDIVINGSIKELWYTSLDSYALAAVEELGCSAGDVYDRLGYSAEYGYFNAGVLLINLSYWRENNQTLAFLDFISLNYNKLRAHDQDVLNALFYDKCLHVSCKWNVEEAFYHYSVLQRHHFNRELRSILCHPVILHYTWKPKPWEESCRHPFKINYLYYLSIFRKERLPWRQRIKESWYRFTFCLLLVFNIKKQKYFKLE